MLSMLAVFAAGIATLATPCVLPLVPIYMAMLLGGSVEAVAQTSSRWRLLLMTGAFAAGFGFVFTSMGLAASALGQVLTDYRSELAIAGGVVIILFGLKFLSVLKLPWLDRDVRASSPKKIGSLFGGFAFGVVFALGWTPCAGPVLASVLSVAALEGSATWGATLLAVYSAGLAAPLLLIAAFADRMVPLMRRLNQYLERMQKVTGTVLVVLGLVIAVQALWQRAPDTDVVVAVDAYGQLQSPLIGADLPRPRLIEVVEDGCPVCQRMAPKLQELQQDCTEHVLDIVTVSLSRSENKNLDRILGVRAVPTLLLVDDVGKIRARVVGERSLDELRGLAAELQSMACAGVEPISPAELNQGAACDENDDGAKECS